MKNPFLLFFSSSKKKFKFWEHFEKILVLLLKLKVPPAVDMSSFFWLLQLWHSSFARFFWRTCRTSKQTEPDIFCLDDEKTNDEEFDEEIHDLAAYVMDGVNKKKYFNIICLDDEKVNDEKINDEEFNEEIHVLAAYEMDGIIKKKNFNELD